jgi:hypothetical protein
MMLASLLFGNIGKVHPGMKHDHFVWFVGLSTVFALSLTAIDALLIAGYLRSGGGTTTKQKKHN